MADTASRPTQSRGPRGSGRGGRGGSRAGGRFGNRQSNGDLRDTEPADDFTDHGELGEMKKQYGSSLIALRELFPDWTDADLLFALQETSGDLTSTVERISEGHVSKFADVKHHKERAPKAKVDKTTGSSAAPLADGKPMRAPRGDRGDSVRGGRGRGSERGGRGGSRGGRGGHAANGDRAVAGGSVPTPSDGWESSADILANEANKEESSAWTNVVTSKDTPAAASEGAKPSLLPENSAPAKKTWAQMFAKPIAPVQSKATAPTPAVPAPVAQESTEPAAEEPTPAIEQEETPIPLISDEAASTGSFEMVEAADAQAEETPALEITPSQEPLTEENVENLPDDSNLKPAPVGTEASTIDSTHAPDSAAPSVLNQPVQQPPIGRPGLGGFATTALKATSGSGTRSASFQRRILEQQESVVMPGSRDAVGSTALQFGSMGLNGEAEDIDDEREEPETRAAPQPSPPSQPRATLPPAPRQATAAESAPEPVQQQQQQSQPQTIKPAPGLPPAPQQQAQQQSPSATANSQYMSQQGSQAQQGYGQYSRYGQSGMPSDTTASAASKPYDAFGQQPSSYDSFGHGQQQGAYSSAASNDYSSYYTADQRNAYQNYYNSAYGQQGYGGQQDSSAAQRTASNYGQGTGESGYPTSQSQQGRYNDTQSGHNTPAPSNTSGQQTGATQGQQHSHLNQQAHSQNQHTQYPGYGYGGYGNRGMDYNNYYNMQGYGYGGQNYGQQGYGGAFGGKGMYGGPHHGYGMSPQTGYDQHSASPATRGQDTYTQQSHGRDSALSGGLGDYTRSGSTQPSQGAQQSSNTSAYGGMHDNVFGRGASGYQGQSQQYGQQTGSAQDQDSLKGYGTDNKSGATGQSTSALGGQPGRPGSATNSALPPPQSQQHGAFGQGYPSQQNSQYGSGLGSYGSQQQQQGQQQSAAGGYGQYNSGFGNYGQYNSRGGWGGSYGH